MDFFPRKYFQNIITTIPGFSLVCTLTACGDTFCYLLARMVGQDIAFKYFPSKINAFKSKLDENYDRYL
jgi:uncharacterized membrane protein YdjX (TVP38/TMEM64 family)